jgi:hypothetical protein
MSKILDKFREMKIFNEYDFLNDGDPMIYYTSQDDWSCSGWMVYVKGKKFKDSHWNDDGGKKFIVHGRKDKYFVLKQAMCYVKKFFPDVELVKSPFRETYVAKTTLEQRMLELENFEKGER